MLGRRTGKSRQWSELRGRSEATRHAHTHGKSTGSLETPHPRDQSQQVGGEAEGGVVPVQVTRGPGCGHPARLGCPEPLRRQES